LVTVIGVVASDSVVVQELTTLLIPGTSRFTVVPPLRVWRLKRAALPCSRRTSWVWIGVVAGMPKLAYEMNMVGNGALWMRNVLVPCGTRTQSWFVIVVVGMAGAPFTGVNSGASG